MTDETFLYLTTTGHSSGQPHRIEIWYVEHQGRHYIVAERFERAHWVQNIRHQPRVTYSIGTRSDNGNAVPGRARPLHEEADANLITTVKALMDAKYGWSNGLIVALTPTEASEV
jgi:deazaflavin-dependent oxidoreductase (nitroreductase family)